MKVLIRKPFRESISMQIIFKLKLIPSKRRENFLIAHMLEFYDGYFISKQALEIRTPKVTCFLVFIFDLLISHFIC